MLSNTLAHLQKSQHPSSRKLVETWTKSGRWKRGSDAHVQHNDPIKREHRKQSNVTGYRTEVQKGKESIVHWGVSTQWFWLKQCKNPENDQRTRSPKWSEKILEAGEIQQPTKHTHARTHTTVDTSRPGKDLFHLLKPTYTKKTSAWSVARDPLP